MDQEASEIITDFPDTPTLGPHGWAYGGLINQLGKNSTVTFSFREGRPFIEIWPDFGGWLGFFLEDGLADIAPDAG